MRRRFFDQSPTKGEVNLASDCCSEWFLVPAGVALAQGSKHGSWPYIVMIDDLNTVSNDLCKYEDDTTLTEVILERSSNVQFAVNNIQNQSNALTFTLNDDK